MFHDNNFYILDGHEPVRVKDALEWAEWFETADRIVKKTLIHDIEISTVFLGINHNYFGGPPLLFETMIFGGEHDEYQDRCGTWDEAEDMHKKAMELVRRSFLKVV